MTRPAVRVLVLVSIVTTVAFAQTRRAVTAGDYDRATRMLTPALNGLVVGGTADATTWLPDGRFSYTRTTPAGTENVIVDPVKKTREVATAAPAAPAAAAAGGRGGRAGGGGGLVDEAVSRSRKPAGLMSLD